MSTDNLRIDAERLRADIDQLASIGRREDQGIYRMAFSDGDMQARDWLMQRINDAGLSLYQDGAANIHARLGWREGVASVMAGSHIDTVPGAGHLDGALGVLCALEALRVLKEAGTGLKRPGGRLLIHTTIGQGVRNRQSELNQVYSGILETQHDINRVLKFWIAGGQIGNETLPALLF
mgnify:CR=1 FL=1